MNLTKISDYTDKDYASFWRSSERKYFDDVEQAVIEKLLPEKGKWFIDLGCGFGRFADLYGSKYDNIVMLDYSPNLLVKAKESFKRNDKRSRNIFFILSDIYNLPFRDNLFDVSLMTRVFHHFESPQQIIKQLNRILTNNGTLLFNYDNKRNLREIIKYYRKSSSINPFTIEHNNLVDNDLLYCTHPLFVDQLLKKYDFQTLGKCGVGLFYGRCLKYIYKPAMIEKYLTNVLGRLSLSQLIFIKAILKEKLIKSRHRISFSKFTDLLICPNCKSESLFEQKQHIKCQKCHSCFPITNGMYDFRKLK
jgi:SAM-dependent methyltransferase